MCTTDKKILRQKMQKLKHLMLVTNIALNTKIGEVENKTPHHELYIITQELNK